MALNTVEESSGAVGGGVDLLLQGSADFGEVFELFGELRVLCWGEQGTEQSGGLEVLAVERSLLPGKFCFAGLKLSGECLLALLQGLLFAGVLLPVGEVL
jgi:hypothetical protein